MKAGAHVSTAGGPATGFERAEAIGAEAMQCLLNPFVSDAMRKLKDCLAHS